MIRFGAAADTDFWINGGYMVLSQEIFDYINEGDELVEEPFRASWRNADSAR